VPQQVQDDVEDATEDENDDNEVSVEPTPPSPTPITPPLSPTQEHTCATLTNKVTNLEQDKIAQAIQITKLKQRVRRLEKKRQFKSLGLKRLRKDTNEAEPAKVEEVIEVVTAAKLITEVVTIASTTITAAQVVPKASAPRRRKGVVIHDLEETATASVIIHSEVKSKDKGKDQVKRKEKQDNIVMIYQALKRNPVTKAQARKNIMVYLKNMVGFKMNFFKGMTYTDIRPIFEKHYNSIQAFMEKGDKEIEEEGSKRKNDSPEQKAAKKQRIDEEEEELKAHLQIVVNDDVWFKLKLLDENAAAAEKIKKLL
nr:hypothetical protein [Tanacetum cinerariifolium]